MPHIISLYVSAALSIGALGFFARQNRKSGWMKLRPSLPEALRELYAGVGVATEERKPDRTPAWKPLTNEELIGFSAQMLKLRSALGTHSPVTQETDAVERNLVHQ
ncbi:MAG: hypothetical protein M3Z09_18070 [Acidobacteriota bacterium]|nr:hypothetical protein [Acidobacteriota bacterium]